jgi:hypothetical protein
MSVTLLDPHTGDKAFIVFHVFLQLVEIAELLGAKRQKPDKDNEQPVGLWEKSKTGYCNRGRLTYTLCNLIKIILLKYQQKI